MASGPAIYWKGTVYDAASSRRTREPRSAIHSIGPPYKYGNSQERISRGREGDDKRAGPFRGDSVEPSSSNRRSYSHRVFSCLQHFGCVIYKSRGRETKYSIMHALAKPGYKDHERMCPGQKSQLRGRYKSGPVASITLSSPREGSINGSKSSFIKPSFLANGAHIQSLERKTRWLCHRKSYNRGRVVE